MAITSGSTITASDVIDALEIVAAGKSDKGHTHTKSQITDFPTIPTVGNGTVTINQAGTTKGTFTLNQSDNATIELTDNNTHYTTHLYAGSGSAANASTTNGNTKLTLTDDTTVRNNIVIKGTGGITVTSDANGNIIINGPKSLPLIDGNSYEYVTDVAVSCSYYGGAATYTVPGNTVVAVKGSLTVYHDSSGRSAVTNFPAALSGATKPAYENVIWSVTLSGNKITTKCSWGQDRDCQLRGTIQAFSI